MTHEMDSEEIKALEDKIRDNMDWEFEKAKARAYYAWYKANKPINEFFFEYKGGLYNLDGTSH